ncbi:TPA: type III secretion system needle complex protein [Yersinia enterocolitica]|nr:type III secretion system needle complex protein [Yersinia enterocolitica]HDL6985305.1 type III secretion system needle complex protein [Yersinia enterocolitica]HDL7067847.1 type III secretion system needle complex protein [Yersinia enterocolitica]HDL7072237.1 type III secretion system needle complex protein [Yersinia enterocolitica]
MSYIGYIDSVKEKFDAGVLDLSTQVDKALDDLSKNPSDPALLAAYQSKLSEYTLYRNAQSNIVKAYKDLDSSIVQNFR